VSLHLPELAPGPYRVTAWDTFAGVPCAEFVARAHPGAGLHVTPPAVHTDLALAVRRIEAV
jgi:mannan endo-1,4-beta-mannosidase